MKAIIEAIDRNALTPPIISGDLYELEVESYQEAIDIFEKWIADNAGKNQEGFTYELTFVKRF